MNLFVCSADGKCGSRPDSSRFKDNGDIFFSDAVSELGWAPAAYLCLDRSGKAVGKQFAPRYWSKAGFGILLYPDGKTFFDGTSLLPLKTYARDAVSDGELAVKAGGRTIFSAKTGNLKERLEDALVLCSENCTVRIGDFIIAELAPVSRLCSREAGAFPLEMTFSGDKLTDVSLKF